MATILYEVGAVSSVSTARPGSLRKPIYPTLPEDLRCIALAKLYRSQRSWEHLFNSGINLTGALASRTNTTSCTHLVEAVSVRAVVF
jgi:type II secretory pathway component PulF